MPMNILVTGGAGFIGSNLIRFLVSRGDSVLNLDKLTYAGNPASLADLAANPAYQLRKIDLCDDPALRLAFAEFQPDSVIHLAAESHVDRSIDQPGEFIRTNLVGTYSLLQAARGWFDALHGAQRERFRFLHVSTDEVYGSLGDEGTFHEETRYDPHSPYSASKAGADHLVRAWLATYGLPTIIANSSNNYGPYQFPEKLIPLVILRALRGEPIPIYGNGENVRDWLYVGDHVEALALCLEKGTIGETYNIGDHNERRNLDLVRLLCQILDELRPRHHGSSYADQITFVRDRPGHDHRYAIDSSKIRRDLGWIPKQDHHSGFRETVQWYLDNEAWWNAIPARNRS